MLTIAVFVGRLEVWLSWRAISIDGPPFAPSHRPSLLLLQQNKQLSKNDESGKETHR